MKTKCKNCGSELVLYQSLYKKYCDNCKTWFDWPLHDNQKSILTKAHLEKELIKSPA